MQGISVYSRTGRKNWYVAYDCPVRCARVNESSGIRVDDPRGKMAAYAYAREKAMSGVTHGAGAAAERYDAWVEPWLRERYRNQKWTLTGYLGAWKHLSFFLRENKIFTPRALTYASCVSFVRWRESQIKKTSGRKVSRNTALHNVKVLSRVQREAVRRGYCQGNPAFRLAEDVPPDPVPEKPEFTNEQIAVVRAELERRSGIGRPSDWMSIAFEIALHQGCRLAATQIPLEHVDLAHGTLRLVEKGKNGKPTVFTAMIHPALLPLLTRLKAEPGRTHTCVLPRFASRNFGRVLRAIGLTHPEGTHHHTFHSTRVTVVSRMARDDVSQQKAMAYVHHSSWLVHKVYTRLRPADVQGCFQALAFSAKPAAPQNPGGTPSTPTPLPASNSGP